MLDGVWKDALILGITVCRVSASHIQGVHTLDMVYKGVCRGWRCPIRGTSHYPISPYTHLKGYPIQGMDGHGGGDPSISPLGGVSPRRYHDVGFGVSGFRRSQIAQNTPFWAPKCPIWGPIMAIRMPFGPIPDPLWDPISSIP